MENFKLSGSVREDAGKGVARQIRFAGNLPAVLYGHKQDPVSLVVDEAVVRKILNTHPDSPIVSLSVEGQGDLNAIIRDVQRHPTSGRLVHLDFQRISLDEAVRVDVHVDLQGTPVGVKDHGGILEAATRTVTVSCLPADIPEGIFIDVSEMQIQDSIKLSDVSEKYPGVEFLGDADLTLAAVFPPSVEKKTAEEEAAEAEAAEAAAGEEGAPAADAGGEEAKGD